METITIPLQSPIVAPERAVTVKRAHTAGQASADDSPVLHAAIGLAEQIRSASEEIARGRRLPPSMAGAVKKAGVFGMAMPRVWGRPGAGPVDAVPRNRGTGYGGRFGRVVRDDRL